MKAVVYEGPGILQLQEVADVSPQPKEVKIKIRACGICGSDVHGYLGLTGRRIAPMIMGHEFAGEVVQLGTDVKHLKEGDRVAVYPVDFCGECEMCQKGDVHLCLNKRAFGVLDVDGAFAEYICVPEKSCFKVSEEVPYEIGSLMEPLAVSYRGVGHAGDIEGKSVLLVGTIGLLALACVKMKNPGQIMVSDLSDHRLEIAKQMGADFVINPSKEDFKEAIQHYTQGHGVDVAIEAVGLETTVQQAMSALGFGKTAIWIGNNKPVIQINMQEVVTRELRVHGSFLYGYQEFETVVDLLNGNQLNVKPLISKTIALEEIPAYCEKLAKNPGDFIKVVYVNPS